METQTFTLSPGVAEITVTYGWTSDGRYYFKLRVEFFFPGFSDRHSVIKFQCKL